METLGAPYIPWTFPTVVVRDKMRLSVPSITNSEVDRIWDIYSHANLDGLIPAYNKSGGSLASAGNAKVLNYLATKGIPKMTGAAWLNATADAAGFWGYRWIDPAQSKEAVADAGRTLGDIVISTGDVVGKTLGGVTDPILSNVKWIALGVGVLGLVYIGYEMGLFKKILKRG